MDGRGGGIGYNGSSPPQSPQVLRGSITFTDKYERIHSPRRPEIFAGNFSVFPATPKGSVAVEHDQQTGSTLHSSALGFQRADLMVHGRRKEVK